MGGAQPKIYLAGPDVFHVEAKAIGREKKKICARLGFEGLFPLDNEIETPDDAESQEIAARIYAANIEMLDRADAVVANVTPFLGALSDDGTAFEVGYAVARGLPIVLYDNGVGCTATKAADMLLAAPGLRDPAMTAEDFQLPVNLMLSIAAARSGGVVDGEVALPLTDLSRFEAAVKRVAAVL